MVELINYTQFANLRFSNLDTAGKEFGVFMVKLALDIGEDGRCKISSEQEPFVFTDEHHGELNNSAVRYPSDFVPYKPRSEIILDATAYAPGGDSRPSWQVGVKVSDAVGLFAESRLTVTGPRFWTPRWLRAPNERDGSDWRRRNALFKGWSLSEAEPISKLPIRYDYAFGGTFADGIDEDGKPILKAFEQNPIGRGLIDRNHTDHTKPVPAPQIEGVDTPIADPYRTYDPHGFGPIPPAWLPRRMLGGTYDQDWLDNVWPKWAKDYDFGFHNAANPSLQGARFLEGEVVIELQNLHPSKPDFTIRLPDVKPVAISILENGAPKTLNLAMDTVFLEIAEDFQADPRIYTVWRTPFDAVNTSTINLVLSSAETVARYGAARLRPEEVGCDPELLGEAE